MARKYTHREIAEMLLQVLNEDLIYDAHPVQDYEYEGQGIFTLCVSEDHLNSIVTKIDK